MQIGMTCPNCGAEHTPTRSDLMRPRSEYVLCPACRPAQPDRYRHLFTDVGAPERSGDAAEPDAA